MNLKLTNMFQEVVYTCKHILHHEPIAQDARGYLSGRISKRAQEDYSFGYFPNNENIDVFLSLSALDKESLKKINIIRAWKIAYSKKFKSFFNDHNLIIPLRDGHGRIVSLIGRTLLSEEERKEKKIQKYIYSKGTKKGQFVYGLDKAKQSIIDKNYVICVEGQFDCVSLQDKGFVNSVALCWANMTLFQLFKISVYTKNILLVLDNDDAGRKGMEKIIKRFGKYVNINVFYIPEGYKDMDEFLKRSENVDILINSCLIYK